MDVIGLDLTAKGHNNLMLGRLFSSVALACSPSGNSSNHSVPLVNVHILQLVGIQGARRERLGLMISDARLCLRFSQRELRGHDGLDIRQEEW
jgi:hypothetical protein